MTSKVSSNDTLKFFSPQRGFNKSSLLTHQYTPNTTTSGKDYKSSILPDKTIPLPEKGKDFEKQVEKVSKSYEECKSEINILKQKFKRMEDSKNNSQLLQNEENSDNLEPIGNYNNMSPNKNESKGSSDFGLVLKEWKIRKTNEMIEKFETQTQTFLRENEKLMKISKQRQGEIDKLKATSFGNNCKLKEYESKLELLKEELEHSSNMLREKEEESENWKMKFFENEQKAAMIDSMEYKLMESEYILLDYQKKIEGLVSENERFKNSYEFNGDGGNDKMGLMIEEIDNIYRMINLAKNKEKTNSFLNLSFQTPEKSKEGNLDLAFSQLKTIESFISNENNESVVRKLEKELELEKKEKINLNSRILLLKNSAKPKEILNNSQNNDQKMSELEKQVSNLKKDLEKNEGLRSDLIAEIEKIQKEKANMQKNLEDLKINLAKSKE